MHAAHDSGHWAGIVGGADAPPIILYTDYRLSGPYVGQLRSRLWSASPALTVIDLMHDAPRCNPRRAAYLLSASLPYLPHQAVVLAVVDPGVGSVRSGLAVSLGSRWLVGPDNGLLAMAIRHHARGRSVACYRLPEPGPEASATFHGRDLFAEIASTLALASAAVDSAGGDADEYEPAWPTVAAEQLTGYDWPVDLDEVIYIDGFGNLMTGRRAETVPAGRELCIGEQPIRAARTFADVPPGALFWYRNSMGLVEIAANSASAAERLGVGPGVRFCWGAAIGAGGKSEASEERGEGGTG
ncbi:hypothetical protein CKO15_06450 [Halorhodospira abdelmalekii]|uniref:SAM hydrolase/SAM-dependent halogenase family protein n=1 Tax=Halorhodospira abdelmalekii TaxID=421629 RepID=UPI001904CFEF|nr:SAM-dependent chlorinase/fluorinase [Halorhodospira abdelmalekii]MBK1734932.1 hypothetical protein [Halorhodospira abdelmalekii]